MGTYGLIRFCLPFFPSASVAHTLLIGILAVIGIVYGALVSRAQTDAKKLVAYSSVSHLGFVVLGIFCTDIREYSRCHDPDDQSWNLHGSIIFDCWDVVREAAYTPDV